MGASEIDYSTIVSLSSTAIQTWQNAFTGWFVPEVQYKAHVGSRSPLCTEDIGLGVGQMGQPMCGELLYATTSLARPTKLNHCSGHFESKLQGLDVGNQWVRRSSASCDTVQIRGRTCWIPSAKPFL